jgi:predicted metalloendopeptidase
LDVSRNKRKERKLNKINIKIGYPDKWKISKLDIKNYWEEAISKT